jgi:hypothetical protein
VALIVAGGVLGRRHAARAVGPAREGSGRGGAAVRVGTLMYRVDAVEHALVSARVPGERAGPGEALVVVTVTRSNATQVDAVVRTDGVRLASRGGERYVPARIVPLRCDRDACEVLEPGEARADALVYRVPAAAVDGARLEMSAVPGESGPARRVVELR